MRPHEAPFRTLNSAARAAVTDAGFPRAVVQESGNGDISVRTGELSNDQQHTIRTALAKEGGIYPAATTAQTSDAFAEPPAYFANQADFYTVASEIAKTTAPSAWGPNVNVAYTTFKDAFGAAAKNKSDFGAALKTMQDDTVADMKKQGFEVAE